MRLTDEVTVAPISSMPLSFRFPSISTNYLFPAIFLNPPLLLHLINTVISHFQPKPHIPSISPYPRLEGFGPAPGSTLYLDVHANNQMCWNYTALMVAVQLLAIANVQGNRVKRKERSRQKQAQRDIRDG